MRLCWPHARGWIPGLRLGRRRCIDIRLTCRLICFCRRGGRSVEAQQLPRRVPEKAAAQAGGAERMRDRRATRNRAALLAPCGYLLAKWHAWPRATKLRHSLGEQEGGVQRSCLPDGPLNQRALALGRRACLQHECAVGLQGVVEDAQKAGAPALLRIENKRRSVATCLQLRLCEAPTGRNRKHQTRRCPSLPPVSFGFYFVFLPFRGRRTDVEAWSGRHGRRQGKRGRGGIPSRRRETRERVGGEAVAQGE